MPRERHPGFGPGRIREPSPFGADEDLVRQIALRAVQSLTGVQLATALQAFAELTPAADRLPYFTGGSAAALATFTAFARTILDDADDATVRATLGLGALALLATINGSNWSGTDLAVADGGTGASTASGARTNLGLAIGTNVQAWAAVLNQIVALAPAKGDMLVYNGEWTLLLASDVSEGAVLTLGVDGPQWVSP